MNGRSRATVLISDHHPIFRGGLRCCLKAYDEFEIVGEAWDGESAVREALSKTPDLMLLGFVLPDFSGIEVLRQLQEADARTRVLFVTAGMNRQQILEALQLGARGVLTKDADAELLAKAIRCVLAGEYWIGRDVVADWLDYSRRQSNPSQPLTVREREIANLVLMGRTNREIAAALAISGETVKRHIRNIYDKCGVASRVDLAMYLTGRPTA